MKLDFVSFITNGVRCKYIKLVRSGVTLGHTLACAHVPTRNKTVPMLVPTRYPTPS